MTVIFLCVPLCSQLDLFEQNLCFHMGHIHVLACVYACLLRSNFFIQGVKFCSQLSVTIYYLLSKQSLFHYLCLELAGLLTIVDSEKGAAWLIKVFQRMEYCTDAIMVVLGSGLAFWLQLSTHPFTYVFTFLLFVAVLMKLVYLEHLDRIFSSEFLAICTSLSLSHWKNLDMVQQELFSSNKRR